VTCSICDAIGPSATARTGRDESFEPPVHRLKSLFDSRDNDLMQCPECGALYHWSEDNAFTGSGINDSMSVDRLPDRLQDAVRAFMQRDADTPAQLDELAPHLFALIPVVRDMVLGYLRRRRDIVPALVPHYLAEAVRRNDASIAMELESRTARERDFAARMLAASDASPSPVLEPLVKIARLALCAVCGTLHYEKYERGQLPATHASFRKHASAAPAIWECPDCGTFFTWHALRYETAKDVLERLPEWKATSLRALVHRGMSPVDRKEAADTMYWGEDDLSALMTCALEHDRELADVLASNMTSSVSRSPWMAALLDRYRGVNL
jgi:hypothetical protein